VDYLFECVKAAIKGAYDAGMGVSEFAVLNAGKINLAAKARQDLLIAVFRQGSDPERKREAFEHATKLHPHWLRQQRDADARP
jgi:hypothetical protein